MVRPDLERFPMFDDGLRQAMRRETELFIREHHPRGSQRARIAGRELHVPERAPGAVLRHSRRDRSGVPRVDVSGTERGGGILAQASVLTVSSYSTRTSPVLRGKWILENLLNAPPPPPPPGVPPLDDSKAGQSGTLRQQMEEHRKNPACASCHSRMDPLGFGLENFNAIGAWRTEDGKFPVDASGRAARRPHLPDARRTEGDSQGRIARSSCAPDREAADLCAGPRPGALRPAGA